MIIDHVEIKDGIEYYAVIGKAEYETDIRKMYFLKEKPVCAECFYCSFVVDEFGDCDITDEELWDVFGKVGLKCPIPFPKN